MPIHTIRSARWNYVDRGTGPVIALVHGFPLNSTVWEKQMDALSKTHRVIAPDLPGFGSSTLGDDPFTIESLAIDVHQLLREIGALPCVLGGLSMGGYVALAYAKAFVSTLRGIMFIDTKAEADTDEAKQARNQMIAMARGQGAAAVADKMMPRMLAPGAIESRPQLARDLKRIMESSTVDGIATACAAMRDRADYTAMLAGLNCPALVIVGESDVIIPAAAADKLHGALPDAKKVVIAGAGHMSPLEQPDAVNAAIEQFADALD